MGITQEQHTSEALSHVRAALQHLDALYDPLPGAVANLTVAERDIRAAVALTDRTDAT